MYCSQCGYNNPASAKYCGHCKLNFESGAFNAAPKIKLPAPLYAGFWLRFIAAILDLLIFIACLILLFFSLVAVIALSGRDSIVHNDMAARLFFGTLILLWIAYPILMESGIQGATFGKRWVNIKVTDTRGQRLTFTRASWRFLAHFISWLPLFGGLLMQPFTPRKQALHDMLAATLVVRTRDSKKISVMATVVVLFVALMVPLVAAFATVGLPVFQQHIQKVQLEKGLKTGRQAAAVVLRFHENNGRVPAAWADTGTHINFPAEVASIDINPQNGELTLTFSDSVRNGIRNRHLIFTAVLESDQRVGWKCHSSDIEARLLPDACR